MSDHEEDARSRKIAAPMKDSQPKRALVLSAGFGTRLAPLTRQVPKPLVPIWGRPAIERSLDLLAKWGVREALINVHHGADAMLAWARGFSHSRMRITLSFESEICGTGGPLRKNAWFFDDAPFWIFNADVVADLSPKPLLRALEGHPQRIAALWMLPDRGPRTVATQDDRVVDFSVSQPGSEGTFTFSGLHLVRPEVLGYVPEATFSSVIDVYRDAMRDGWDIGAVSISRSSWHDLGTPEQVIAAHEATSRKYVSKTEAKPVLQQRVTPAAVRKEGGFVSMGKDVQCSKHALLDKVVLGDGVQVKAGAMVREAVVGPGAVVRGSVNRLAMCLGEAVSCEVFKLLEGDGWTRRALAVFPSPRGSDRQFFRLREGARRAFAVKHGDARPENQHYGSLSKQLGERGVRVPRVLAEWPEAGLTLWEDLGDADLLSMVRGASSRALERMYRGALDVACVFHCAAESLKGDPLLQPGFDASLYAWEHDLFMRHCAMPLGGLAGKAAREVLAELECCAQRVADGPQGVVHRDLQSTNIMRHRGEWVLIDFQGMRTGAILYDLASLLADPYVGLPFRVQVRLLERYPAGPASWGARILAHYPDACVQRLVQALGAYGRLSALPGTSRFAEHIRPAFAQLHAALSASVNPMPSLEKFAQKMIGV